MTFSVEKGSRDHWSDFYNRKMPAPDIMKILGAGDIRTQEMVKLKVGTSTGIGNSLGLLYNVQGLEILGFTIHDLGDRGNLIYKVVGQLLSLRPQRSIIPMLTISQGKGG